MSPSKTLIIIVVYNRLHHIKQCLESIEAADKSQYYDVIVGSDAPASEKDFYDIEKVREYLVSKKENNKFKSFTNLFHKENLGGSSNILKCHDYAKRNNYSSFILMEDDVIVGKGFLRFMQLGLSEFQDDEKVIAVTGYRNPELHDTGIQTAYLYDRFSAYGFASWYKKWDWIMRERESKSSVKFLLSDKKIYKEEAFISTHAKSYPFLAENYYSAGDIEVEILMKLNNLWVVSPPKTITANRGLDGSGLRSGINLELQALMPVNDVFTIPDSSNITKVKCKDIRSPLETKHIAYNYFSYITYRYIPFGFKILKTLRTLKKNINIKASK